MKNRSLKFRVLLALLLIVTVTSSLFAGGVMLIKAQLEEVIFGNMVADQLETLKHQLDSNTYVADSLFDGWEFYFAGSKEPPPPQIAALVQGSHHSVAVGDLFYQIDVGQWNGEPAYLAYDVTEWENQEHLVLRMLLYGLLLVMIAALLMGLSASRAILAPVRALTSRLTQIQPGERSLHIAQDYRGSEIWEIAAAFDKYMERLDQFVERERSFTSAASHELRTPLSVMMGAVDVLAANPLSPASERAVARIQRACKEMLAFIEATLYLAREDSNQINQDAPADLAAIIERLIEDNAAQIDAKGIKIERHFHGSPNLDVPFSLIQITASNILRNALEHTQTGSITIEVSDTGFAISDTGEGISAANLDKVFDRAYSTKSEGTGLGLNLVRRICDRFHWQIAIDSTVGVGTKVSIAFEQT